MTTKTNFLPKKDIISAIDQYLSSHDAVEVLFSMQPWGLLCQSSDSSDDRCFSIGIDLRDTSIQARERLADETEEWFFPFISQPRIEFSHINPDDIDAFVGDVRIALTETVCICLSTANDRLDVVYAQSV